MLNKQWKLQTQRVQSLLCPRQKKVCPQVSSLYCTVCAQENIKAYKWFYSKVYLAQYLCVSVSVGNSV